MEQYLILLLCITSSGASSLALAGHLIYINDSSSRIPSGKAAINGIFLSTIKPADCIFLP